MTRVLPVADHGSETRQMPGEIGFLATDRDHTGEIERDGQDGAPHLSCPYGRRRTGCDYGSEARCVERTYRTS